MSEPTPSFEEAVLALRRAVWSEGQEARAFVAGKEPNGMLLVRVETRDNEFTLKVPDLGMLQALIGPQLSPPRPSVPLPYASRTQPPLPARAREVSDEATHFLTGAAAQSCDQIEVLRVGGLSAAAYTCRGPTLAAQGLEYKPYNEDGVVLRARHTAEGRAIVTVGAFDQAGGEGSKDGEPGAASEAGAHALEAVIHDLEDGHDPEEVLHEAATRGDAAVRALGVGAVCTMTAASVVREPDGALRAWVVNVGDSRVLLAAPDGRLKAATPLHNMGARISRGEVAEVPRVLALHFAAGLTRGLGAEDSSPDIQCWDLAPGDRLVIATDGLGDAHEMEETPFGSWHAEACALRAAEIVAAAEDEAAAVSALVGYALDQASDRRGKPDNIGIGVLFVRPESP